MNYEWPILKWFEEPDMLFEFLTKYYGSLNNPLRANVDFRYLLATVITLEKPRK